MSEDVLRLLADADAQPVETDAPDPGAEISYDVALQADLEEHGPDALRQFGLITVRDATDPARWNSILWYCAKWGLAHDRVGPTGDVAIIRFPEDTAA